MSEALDALKGSPLVRSIAAAGVALVVLSLLCSWERLGFRARASGTLLTATMTLVFGAAVTWVVLRQADPPEWDFRSFWLCGRAMTLGENPYDPAVLRRVATFDRSPDFDREVVDVGCWYPPSSLGLFYPLGLLAVRPSYLAWMAVSVVAAFASVTLIAARLQPKTLFGVSAAGALLAAFVPSWQTINTAQTNFLLLLLLLLLVRGCTPFRAGILLGLSIVVKPLAALMLVCAAAVHAWRTVLTAALIVALATLCALCLSGPAVLGSYLFDNPGARLPDWVYTEEVNQSMLAVVVRAASQSHPTTSTMATYLTLALIMGLCTLWLGRLASDDDGALRVGVAVPFALAVYPGTLSHYSLLLLVPFLALWSARHRFPMGSVATVAIGTVIWGLLPQRGAAFFVNCFTWVSLATVILVRRFADRSQRSPQVPESP